MSRGFTMGGVVSPTRTAAFQNGTLIPGVALTGTPVTPTVSIALRVGSRQTGTQLWNTGGLMLVVVWVRALTDAEMVSLADNPWQLFKASSRRMWIPNTTATQRALIMVGAQITQIVDALVGTNNKPLVLYMGRIQQRVADEGVPLVLVNGNIRTLAANETLIL